MLYEVVNYYTGTARKRDGKIPSPREQHEGYVHGIFPLDEAKKLMETSLFASDWGLRDSNGTFYKFWDGKFHVSTGDGWQVANPKE